jgi:formylglycine-generating enzyme required for sulfatase activity
MSGQPDSDALLPTGSKPNCYTDFASFSGAGTATGRVFDLSGNAKEWAQGPDSPAKNPLRGGSYNNASMGLTCDFDFTLGSAELRLPNIGFRCCSTQAP